MCAYFYEELMIFFFIARTSRGRRRLVVCASASERQKGLNERVSETGGAELKGIVCLFYLASVVKYNPKPRAMGWAGGGGAKKEDKRGTHHRRENWN